MSQTTASNEITAQQPVLETLLNSFALLHTCALNAFDLLRQSPVSMEIEKDLSTYASIHGFKSDKTSKSFAKDLFISDTVTLLITRVLFYKMLKSLGHFSWPWSPKIHPSYVDESTISPYIGQEVRNVVLDELKNLNQQATHRFERQLIVLFQTNDDFTLALKLLDEINISMVDEQVLGELYQTSLNIQKRKKLGEYYTPMSIVSYILNRVIFRDGTPQGPILDPACGFGTFLTEFLRMSSNRASSLDLPFAVNNIVGFDINNFSATISRFQVVWAALRSSRKLETLKSVHIVNLDSLDKVINSGEPNDTLSFRDNKKYRYIVGNPPYIRAERLKDGSFLKSLWGNVWQQNADTASLFMYRCLSEWLEDDGRLGFVITGGFANSESGLIVRKLLTTIATLREVVWLEFCGDVWEANAIPMILIIEKKPPKDDDMIMISVPQSWPSSDLDFSEISYAEFFSTEANPEMYFLPFAKKNDIQVLRKLSALHRLGDVLTFKYGIQRGKHGKLSDKPVGKSPMQVIDGKSMFIGGHGTPVGWVDLNTVQKRSIWRKRNTEKYEWVDDQQAAFDFNQTAVQANSGYLAIPIITLAPTAVFISDYTLAALDTAIVASHSKVMLLKAVASYLNSSLVRWMCLVQLRSGVMQGSHRLHVYPRTVESLPWGLTNEAQINDLAMMYDSLAEASHQVRLGSKGAEKTFMTVMNDIDNIVRKAFQICDDDFSYISERLTSHPFCDLTPRYPWVKVANRAPKGYSSDRYENEEEI